MNQTVSRRELARAITTQLLAHPTRHAHWMRVLAAYVVEHKLIDEVDLLINDIAHELFVQTGALTAEVTSAHRLRDTVRTNLQQYLKEATEATHVIVHETVDAELIGGIVARTADHELDTSVQRALRQLAAIA